MMKGMTWDHPRGFDPLRAATKRWQATGGQPIAWDRRSLQDFEAMPLDDLAEQYDLMVIDHPHVGAVAEKGVLHPFGPADDPRLQAIERGSVGASYASYRWDNRQWALPIDAAAQVMAWSPTQMARPPADWATIMTLAREGRVGLPLRAPHALMSLMTLSGLCGITLDARGAALFSGEAVMAVEMLRELWAACGSMSSRQDPIAVLEAMAADDSRIVLSPLIYGYVSYALAGHRPRRLGFADLVAVVGDDPVGSVLGGTGIAVSAMSGHRDEAVRFARWLAGGDIQRNVVALSGGQPAHAMAWSDDAANALTGEFYCATRRTLDRAWVRPRHDRYIAHQNEASAWIVEAFETRQPALRVLERLNALLTPGSFEAPG